MGNYLNTKSMYNDLCPSLTVYDFFNAQNRGKYTQVMKMTSIMKMTLTIKTT